jgi:hypothetical protein
MNNNPETTASKIVGLLETAYDTLRAGTPDLPPVFFKLDHGRKAFSQTWGHFAPQAWTADGSPRHEVMIASECLAAGAEQVLQTVIHEAAHALAEARGVQETSRQGRYHNKRFVKLAEELGLTYECPENRDAEGRLIPDERIGWSHVVLTAETKARYMGVLDLLRREITAFRGNGKFRRSPVKAVTHAYAIFSDEHGELEVIQLGTNKYEKLSPRLEEHVGLVSSVRQGDLERFLAFELGYCVPNATEDGYHYGDLPSVYPELADLEERIDSL